MRLPSHLVKAGTVELDIERIVPGGFGLARTAEGVVFVRGALPGERLTARPREVSGVLRAFAIEILEPHPARVTFELPPGADLPIAYEEQASIKHGLVADALARIAKLDAEIEPVRPSPSALGYRTVAQYVAVEGGGLGARALGSDRIVPLHADALIAEPLVRAFDACRARDLAPATQVVFRGSIHEDRVLVGLLGDRTQRLERLARTLHGSRIAGVTWGETDARGRFRGKSKLLEGEATLLEDLGGILVSVSVDSFSQVNPLAAGRLYLDAATVAGSGARALDLYAGSGVMGMHLARSFTDVVAVEIAPEAVKRGRKDARRLGIENLTFDHADARTASRFFPADVVVVDPPRAGLSEGTVALLLAQQPERIVYISCDPSTWARDVGRFTASGYALTLARPYDFYPFTHHVEVLSVLDLQGTGSVS